MDIKEQIKLQEMYTLQAKGEKVDPLIDRARQLRDASDADEVKAVAEALNIEYTNKREALAAIREKVNG